MADNNQEHLSDWKSGMRKLAEAPALKILFAVVLFVFLAKLAHDHYLLITHPKPLEYREAHSPVSTYLLVNGHNPYDLEFQPHYTNAYGIFFSYVSAPFVKLFGNTYPVYRTVAGIFVLLSCLLVMRAMHREKVPLLLSLAGTLLLYASLLYFITPLARPDSLGVFLLLCAVLVPAEKKYDSVGLLYGALFAIAAFYTKAYFVIAAPLLGSFLFLAVSKKKALIYGGIFILLLVVSVYIVDAVYPTYFNNSFFVFTNHSSSQFSHLIDQVREYGIYNGPFLAAFLLVLVAGLKQKRLLPAFNIDIRHFDRPLFDRFAGLYGYCALVILMLILGKMGLNRGAWMTYFFQLLTPFFIIYVLVRFAGKSYLYPVVAVLLSLNLYIALVTYLSGVSGINYSDKEWALLDSIISGKKAVFNSPMLSLGLLNQGKNIYHSGNSQCFERGWKRQGIWKLLANSQPEVKERFDTFKASVKDAIRNRQFEMIALSRGPRYVTDEPFIAKHYSLIITIPIYMKHATMLGEPQRFDIGIWEPHGKERPLKDRYALYEKLYRCNPQDYHINYYLGFQLFEVLKDYKNAVKFLERAVAVDDSDPIVANALGSIYFNHLKQYQKALPHFLRAYRLAPDDRNTIMNVGYTYRKLGDEVNAKAYLNAIGLE